MSGSSRIRACDFGLQPCSGFKMRHFYQGRNEGGKGAQFPGGESLWGRRMTAWSAGKSQQSQKHSLQHSTFASERPQVQTWGRQTCFLPQASSNLVTPLPFTTLCGYVCRGQQGEIERIHPPHTNSKYRLKSFCEVSYTRLRPNVFGAGKRISMKEFWLELGCMHVAQ